MTTTVKLKTVETKTVKKGRTEGTTQYTAKFEGAGAKITVVTEDAPYATADKIGTEFNF